MAKERELGRHGFWILGWTSFHSRNEKHRVDLPKINGQQPNGATDWELLKQWNDERKFLEDLIYKRLTFLIAFTGFVIAGVLAIKCAGIGIALLVFGLLVAWPLSASVRRAYYKTCYSIGVLVSSNYAPIASIAAVFDPNIKKDYNRGKETLSTVGVVVPAIVILSYFAGLTGVVLLGKNEKWPWWPTEVGQARTSAVGATIVPILEIDDKFKSVVEKLGRIGSKVDRVESQLKRKDVQLDRWPRQPRN